MGLIHVDKMTVEFSVVVGWILFWRKINRVIKFLILRKRWKQKRRVNELLRTKRGMQCHRIEENGVLRSSAVIIVLNIFVRWGRLAPFWKTILAKSSGFGLKYMELEFVNVKNVRTVYIDFSPEFLKNFFVWKNLDGSFLLPRT